MQETGLARVFRSQVGRWAPAQLATFQVAYPETPFTPDLAACAFDGTNRVLFPHRLRAVPLIYDLEGRPVMASAAEHDLSAKGLTNAHGFCATRDALYVLDSYPSAVIRVARP